jgi:hypothetical protein
MNILKNKDYNDAGSKYILLIGFYTGRVNPYINAHGICIYDQHDQHENQLQTVDFRALVESSELPAS